MPATIFWCITITPKLSGSKQWTFYLLVILQSGLGPSWVILLLILPMAAHVDYPAGRSSGTWIWLGCWDGRACLSGLSPLMWLLQWLSPHSSSQQTEFCKADHGSEENKTQTA